MVSNRPRGGVSWGRGIPARAKESRVVTTQAYASLCVSELLIAQLGSSPSAVSVDWGAFLTGDRLALSTLSLVVTFLFFLKLRDADVANAELVEEKRLSRELSAQVQEFIQGKDATSKEMEKVNSEAEELRQQLEAARDERQQTAESLASSQQAVARLTDTLQGVSDARDRLEEQMDASRVREAQATEELTATAAVLVELKARAAQGQADAAKHKQEIQGLRQEYRTMTVTLDDKVERLQKELKARDAKVAQQAEDISGLRVELSELGLNAQVAIDDLREDLQKSEERLKLSQRQLSDLSAGFDDLAAEKAQLLQEREQLLAQLDDADKAGLEAETLLQASTAKIETLEKARNAAVQDARELLGEVREMKFALEESDAAAEHLTSELSAVQAEAEKAQRMVMDMSQQRSASEASLTAAHQAITEAAARERELVEQLQKADEANETLQREVSEAADGHTAQLEQAESKISALENDKAEAEAEARSLTAELEAVRSEPTPAAPVSDPSYETARSELGQLRAQLKKAQAAAGRPAGQNGGMAKGMDAAFGEPGPPPSSSSEQVMLSSVRTGDELAAEAQIEAANRRAVEVRAEAAMLVEAIEDRAHSAIEEAQAEAAKNAAEVHRLKQELELARGTIDLQ
ncbi:g11080 [Coccomyxa viridis]|uniref:G11080 protein n=1 Tax=Coccomyxa viridis TaxID=1274662 RepID=A0ABP1GBJ2_9CHLO